MGREGKGMGGEGGERWKRGSNSQRQPLYKVPLRKGNTQYTSGLNTVWD